MMKEQFLRAMDGFCLPDGAVITVALSGGKDSVALLWLLKTQCKFTLRAVHVNHGLRGENALRDQQFCESLCGEWGIPITVHSGDAAAYAKEHGMSIEEGARALRYGFLDGYADGENCFVATAHHREDQLETFFINLYRGSGSGGLSGIKPRRAGYLRPLLAIPKEQLDGLIAEQGLPFVTDETNADTAYLRNFIRHEVLPLLNSRAEGRFSEGLAHAMGCLQDEEEALALWAEEVQTDAAEELGRLPRAVLKRVLDRMNGAPLDRLHFEQIEQTIRSAPPAAQVQLANGRYFRLEYGRCVFVSPAEQVRIPLPPEASVAWGDWKFEAYFEEINSPFTHFQLDYDRIEGNPVLRRKADGDVFRPAGKGGTARLQKRLKNDRVPRSRRESLWVLADGLDRVIWVEGYGAAEGFGRTAETKRIYCVKIGNIKGDMKNDRSG